MGKLYATPFCGTATVMGNRCDILQCEYFNPGSGDAPNCGFATRTWTFDPHFSFLHAQGLSFFGGLGGYKLSHIRRCFSWNP